MSKANWIAVGLLGLAGLAGVHAWAATEMELPPPRTEGGRPLMEALALRQTIREHAPDPISDDVLSSLLWAANGVNRPATGHRTTPSARNWKGIDIYVARPDGLYLYQPDPHRLRRVMAEDVRPHAGKQAFVQNAPVVLIFAADHSRMADAASETVRFYSAIDTGYISQNVYLFCAAHDLATVAIGWVDKPALGRVMQLGPDQEVVLTQPVAHPHRDNPVQEELAVAETRTLRDGVYRGAGDGYIGDVVVHVRIEEGRLAAVDVIEHAESRPLDALDVLPGAILEAQGVEGVDAVTGATYTSQALFDAVRQALEKAAE